MLKNCVLKGIDDQLCFFVRLSFERLDFAVFDTPEHYYIITLTNACNGAEDEPETEAETTAQAQEQ